MTQTGGPYRTFRRGGGVRLERLLAAPPEEVWQPLVDPEQAAPRLTTLYIEPRVGGSHTLSFDNGMPTRRGHITVFEPPALLEFGWYEGEAIRSRVRLELRAADPGTTVLTLIHTLLRDVDDLHTFADGWTYHLGRLGAQVTTRVARPVG